MKAAEVRKGYWEKRPLKYTNLDDVRMKQRNHFRNGELSFIDAAHHFDLLSSFHIRSWLAQPWGHQRWHSTPPMKNSAQIQRYIYCYIPTSLPLLFLEFYSIYNKVQLSNDLSYSIELAVIKIWLIDNRNVQTRLILPKHLEKWNCNTNVCPGNIFLRPLL